MMDDPAIALTCAYLRVNGYFTLTEIEIHHQVANEDMAVTDIDVLAVRLPTSDSPQPRVTSGVMVAVDPTLDIAEGKLDVLIIEVKQGQIEFNPAIRHPLVLKAALHRVGGGLGDTTATMAKALANTGRYTSSRAQVRLLATGSSGRVTRGTSITHHHMLEYLRGHVKSHQRVLRGRHIADPVVAFMELIEKANAD